MKKMTKKEGRDYLKRWKGVHQVLVKERRNVSLSKKLCDFFVLLDAFASLITSNKKRNRKPEEEQVVSKRWARLRYHFLHG